MYCNYDYYAVKEEILKKGEWLESWTNFQDAEDADCFFSDLIDDAKNDKTKVCQIELLGFYHYYGDYDLRSDSLAFFTQGVQDD